MRSGGAYSPPCLAVNFLIFKVWWNVFQGSWAQTWHQKLYQNGPRNLENRGWWGGSHRFLGLKIVKILILCALFALGRSWWRLGGVLGAFWDRFERLLGPNLVPKMEPRCSKNRFKNRSFFWCLLGSIFGWILVEFRAKTKPSWHQNGIKNRC